MNATTIGRPDLTPLPVVPRVVHHRAGEDPKLPTETVTRLYARLTELYWREAIAARDGRAEVAEACEGERLDLNRQLLTGHA